VEYSGLSAEQTAGSGWQAAIDPDDLEGHAVKWREAVATGKPHENEVRLRRSDGQYRWHLDRGVPLRDEDGSIVKWYGVATDIEDRKRAEHEHEKLRQLEAELAHVNRVSVLGEMAASLAHEISSPSLPPSPALTAASNGSRTNRPILIGPVRQQLYSSVFKQLEEDHLPLLYHCTAGKDRTGVFSAFLLLALGVPEQTVLADYALTNIYLPPNSQFVHKMMAASANDSLAKLSPGQRNVLMAADPEYLRSTLRAIDAKYGSFDNYRRQELHVSDSDVQELRSRLLMQ
jgi:PAS domain S-box-containing protein